MATGSKFDEEFWKHQSDLDTHRYANLNGYGVIPITLGDIYVCGKTPCLISID